MSMLSAANAEAPKSSTVAGLQLGDTPQSIVQRLKTRYPHCDHQRSAYRPMPGETAGPLAIVAINEGTMNMCQGTPEGDDSTDIVIVRFAHPSIAADRGAFEILVNRLYPDPLLTPRRQVRYTLDKVLADLKRRYGRPTDEHSERAKSQSASIAASLGVAPDVKRDDRFIRLLWATKGRLDHVQGDSGGHGHAHYECDCGDRYLIADIETTRSPATRPANRAYVTRVSLFMQQADVRGRQDAWNAQWQRLDASQSQPPPAEGAVAEPVK